jgi:hypothetical protein
MNAKSQGRLELVLGAFLFILGASLIAAGGDLVGRWLVLSMGAFGISRGFSRLRRASTNVNP